MSERVQKVVKLIQSEGKQYKVKGEKTLSFYVIDNTIEHIGLVWKTVEEQVAAPGLTSQWRWVETWLSCYKDTVDYWFLIALHADKPCAITLITKEKERKLPLPVQTYHIGTDGEAYKERIGMVNNTILASKKYKISFYKGLFEVLTSFFRWEEIVCSEFNKEESELLLPLLTNTKYTVHIEKHPTLYYDFRKYPNTPVLENFSKDTRYKLRKSLKFFNDLKVEWAENSAQALEIQNELIHFYNATWKKFGKRSMFDSDRFRLFQERIIKKLIQDQSVILFRVKSKKYGTLGCLSLFVDNGVGYGYQLGFNDFSNIHFGNINKKRLRIGYIVHALCMEECRKRRILAYNFSLGIYPYKKDLSNATSEVVTIALRRNMKPYIREVIVKIYNKLNEKKKTPRFLKIFRSVINW